MLAVRALLSIVVLVYTVTTAAAQPAACTFVLGFAALHNAIPGPVGACVTDESHNPVNGDGLQSTTNGLLVWRKADNLTAFTNGAQTWIDGPFGLQMRLDNQRFFWEPNPDGLAIVPTPSPAIAATPPDSRSRWWDPMLERATSWARSSSRIKPT